MKVVFTIPLVHWGITGVLAGAILSAVVIYTLYAIQLQFVLKTVAKHAVLSRNETYGYAYPTFFTILGLTSIYSTDIILVRHFFSAGDSGVYEALAILGKIIYYASSSVVLVLFPVLSERTAKGISGHTLIRSGILAVSVLSIAITVIYFLFPNAIIGLLFGRSYHNAGPFLGLFAVFITFYSIAAIIINSCLAIGKTGILRIVTACTIFQIIAIVVLHGSLYIIIAINIGIAVLLTTGSVFYYSTQRYEKI